MSNFFNGPVLQVTVNVTNDAQNRKLYCHRHEKIVIASYLAANGIQRFQISRVDTGNLLHDAS